MQKMDEKKVLGGIKNGKHTERRIFNPGKSDGTASLFYGFRSSGNYLFGNFDAGLYDADFIKWLRAMNDPMPSLRGMVVEYGVGVETVYYEERKRRSGKSKQNLDSLLSVATKNLVNYSVVIPRMCEILAIVLMFSSFAAEIVLLVLKMAFGFNISVGIGTGFVILTFLIGVLIFVLGLLAEYLNILNQRMLNRPLVIEKERINFDKDNNK